MDRTSPLSRSRVVGRRSGFTLVEIMISLAITAMIGAGVSAMLFSVQRGTEDHSTRRRMNVRERVVAARVSASIRSAKMVLDRSTQSLVLWMGDSRRNNRPDLSEIQRIHWDSRAAELWAFAAPPDLADEQDRRYELSDDFDRITEDLMDTPWFPGERWGTRVDAWSTGLDEPEVQRAALVNFRLTVEDGEISSVGLHSAALRSR